MIQRTVPYTIGVVGTRRAVSSKDSTARCAATKTFANKGLYVIGGAKQRSNLVFMSFLRFLCNSRASGNPGRN